MKPGPKPYDHLSKRQLEIIHWKAAGKTTEEIATIMGISVHTVNTHVERAFKLTNTVNITALVATAIREGWMV